ncbi:MAG: hypothetical protein GY898_13010 [Proteobacteria bacterium]|nr:hypothetical protein [Pseudomonadota bacterium]
MIAGELTDLSGPSWSRDGKHLAFSARLPRGGLYTLAVDLPDVQPQRITEEGVHPDFSPGGQRIAYSTEPIGRPLGKHTRSSLKIVDLAGLDRSVLLEGTRTNRSGRPTASASPTGPRATAHAATSGRSTSPRGRPWV